MKIDSPFFDIDMKWFCKDAKLFYINQKRTLVTYMKPIRVLRTSTYEKVPRTSISLFWKSANILQKEGKEKSIKIQISFFESFLQHPRHKAI